MMLCCLLRYFSAFLTEKKNVLSECGKGLVTIECFLDCQGSNFDLMYRSVFHWLVQNESRLQNWQNQEQESTQLSQGG